MIWRRQSRQNRVNKMYFDVFSTTRLKYTFTRYIWNIYLDIYILKRYSHNKLGILA